LARFHTEASMSKLHLQYASYTALAMALLFSFAVTLF
jgi:hypothetical protein